MPGVPVYTLSFSHRINRNKETLNVYRFVRVDPTQISKNTTRWVEIPVDEYSENTIVESEGTKEVLINTGNGELRELTDNERKTYYTRRRAREFVQNN